MKTRLQNAIIIGILSLSLAIYPAQAQDQPNLPGSIANKLPVIQNWMMEGNQEYANAGYSVATAGDVNGDGFSDVIVGAPQFDNESAGEGRAYVYYGSISGLGTIPAWTGEGNEVGARIRLFGQHGRGCQWGWLQRHPGWHQSQQGVRLLWFRFRVKHQLRLVGHRRWQWCFRIFAQYGWGRQRGWLLGRDHRSAVL